MRMKFDVVSQDKDSALSQALEYIHVQLDALKLKPKDAIRAGVMCEESLLTLLKRADFSQLSYFVVNVHKLFGDVIIDLSVPGEEFDFYGNAEVPYHIDDDELQETQAAVQSVILRSFSRYLRYKHYRRFNAVRVKALLSNYSGLYKTLTILFLAIVSGVMLKSFSRRTCICSSTIIYFPLCVLYS